MKKAILFLSLCLFAVLENQSFSQCSYKRLPKRQLKTTPASSIPQIDVSTRFRTFFLKGNPITGYNFGAGLSFVKSGEQALVYLFINRRNSKKFYFTPETPLYLTTKNNRTIKMAPISDFPGKYMLNVWWVGCFYEVNYEDLKIIAKDQVSNVKLVITGKSKIGFDSQSDSMGWKVDQKTGENYYLAKISTNNYRENIRKGAECILNQF